MQKVLANICQARNLHGKALKKGWMVVSTGNRQSDRAGANRVLSHLRNRETVYELETHLDDWTSWAIDHGVKPVVISFIRNKYVFKPTPKLISIILSPGTHRSKLMKFCSAKLLTVRFCEKAVVLSCTYGITSGE